MKTKISKKSILLPLIALTIVSCKDEPPLSIKFGDQARADEAESQIEVQGYATDPNIDTGTKEFLKVLNTGGTPLEKMPVNDARNVLINAQAGVKIDLSGIEESEKTITAGGHTVVLNIVRPEGAKGKLPVFMFIHGGGWVLGDYPTHKRLIRDLVVRSGFAAVFVNYSLSPEAKYPKALNEIYAATKWVAENGNEINVDGTKLAIVGNSAGGNLATATALMAKENNGPKIKLQVLLWPVTDADFNTVSYQQFGTDRFLTSSLMQWMWNQYISADKRNEIYAAPLRASTEQLKGLPPTLIQVAENDILRDEGEAYGRKLDNAGVNVTTIRYNGMIHDFGLLNALAHLPTTHSMFDHAAAALKNHLK